MFCDEVKKEAICHFLLLKAKKFHHLAKKFFLGDLRNRDGLSLIEIIGLDPSLLAINGHKAFCNKKYFYYSKICTLTVNVICNFCSLVDIRGREGLDSLIFHKHEILTHLLLQI